MICIMENNLMNMNTKGITGALIGDIVGSRFERYNIKNTGFDLFDPSCSFTDDTVMTIAVAEWLTTGGSLAGLMQKWGRRYPNVGYGGNFYKWLHVDDPQPYNSYGNGSAMRVSPVGFYAKSLDEVMELSKETADVSHNHPQAITGARAIAAAIYLARNGKSKDEIRDYVEAEFGYDLHSTCDEIRPTYRFDVSCQGSCPQAIVAFLDSHDYESAIRLAVSLGGDSDTIACMAGGIAAAFYGVPEEMLNIAKVYLSEDMISILESFEQACNR